MKLVQLCRYSFSSNKKLVSLKCYLHNQYNFIVNYNNLLFCYQINIDLTSLQTKPTILHVSLHKIIYTQTFIK